MDPKTADAHRDGVVLLDVREDDEWAAGHIDGAKHIPFGELPGRHGELVAEHRVVTVCRTGGRAPPAQEQLPGSDGTVAVVVDPQRDIDRVTQLLERLDVTLALLVETHIHNDYVTGGLERARRFEVDYVMPADSVAEFGHVAATDGDVLSSGAIRLRVLHTPGHTNHHVSYSLAENDDAVRAVFTSGSMLFGSTGRTDLVGPDDTVALTHAQYHWVRRLAEEVPEAAEVLPTHGFGSFCSAIPTSGNSSTVGQQKLQNPALTDSERDYVDNLIAGLSAVPAYYARMSPANRRGPAPVDLGLPTEVDADELRRRIDAGEWVVDLRERTAFAARHLAGSLGFELSDSFVTYLGWLYQEAAPLTLIGENTDQVDEIPDGEVYIYCGSGYRASIAASVLDRPGRGRPGQQRLRT